MRRYASSSPQAPSRNGRQEAAGRPYWIPIASISKHALRKVAASPYRSGKNCAPAASQVAGQPYATRSRG